MNNNFDIAIVQLSGKESFYWALRRVSPYEVLITSDIAAKFLIEKQAQEIADEFGLVVMVEER